MCDKNGILVSGLNIDTGFMADFYCLILRHILHIYTMSNYVDKS